MIHAHPGQRRSAIFLGTANAIAALASAEVAIQPLPQYHHAEVVVTQEVELPGSG
jgi:hypothetical protein